MHCSCNFRIRKPVFISSPFSCPAPGLSLVDSHICAEGNIRGKNGIVEKPQYKKGKYKKGSWLCIYRSKQQGVGGARNLLSFCWSLSDLGLSHNSLTYLLCDVEQVS